MSLSVMAQEQGKKEEVMTKSKGTYVINTTTLCNTPGFKSTTPLLVTIKKNVIVKVEALANMETPKFFKRVVDTMLPKYTDLKFEEYEKVDCVSGATMSSNSVRAHMKEAYEYYKKNK